MVEEEPAGAEPKIYISPETLASIDKITAITLSCTKQLQVINDAMERVLEKQMVVEDLAQTLEQLAGKEKNR